MNDEYYMNIALTHAQKGIGRVNPNPLVGCIIVKEGEIVGKGYHEKYGDLHAERNAIANCTKSALGAIMYVTLEPCSHYGKTPPCTEAIIKSGISKVIVGTLDPNEKVAGKGIDLLKKAGIEVVVGILEEKCKAINQVFFHFIKTKTPYIVMKYAMTMDGKIATVTGQSKWITGELARENVHHDRNYYSGILVGVDSVIADNPLLTCRIRGGRNPTRIICDTNLRTPIDCNIITTSKKIRTIIATSEMNIEKHTPFLNAGCEIIIIPKENRHINLKKLMVHLGEIGIDGILLEGGSTLNFSALKSNIVSKIQCYISPKIFGGRQAKTPVGGEGFNQVLDCIKLKESKIMQIGEDFMIESEVENPCLQE